MNIICTAYANRICKSASDTGGELLSGRHLEECGSRSLTSHLKQHLLLPLVTPYKGARACSVTCNCKVICYVENSVSGVYI